ncbi:MAG TPA: thrombospondin type 3 repeat-containing protein, partial [Polyangiaceae bacterium]|nr:thrombospondin type 3 repeat-containing protein [Polyangiaceae bacterium]
MAALCPRSSHAQAPGSAPAAGSAISTPAEGTSAAASPAAEAAPPLNQAPLTPTPLPSIPDDSLAPRGNLWELGLFGGLLFVSNNNALHTPDKPFADFKQPSPEFGLRVAYLPLSFLGLEIEGMGAAGALKSNNGVSSDGEGAVVWAARGHLLLQVPTRSVTPFILGGAGRMGIVSKSVGNDNDPELHFGGGLKINLGRTVALRLDGRDNITKQRPEANMAHHIEGLLGFSLVFGRPDRPKDSDGDGITDLQDICPNEAGAPPDGCPFHDADKDGIADASDQCPNEAGPAPTGCPVRDSDGDGIPDATDECRDVPGVAPSGCPDTDGDGVLDRDDRCLDVPGVPPDGCP